MASSTSVLLISGSGSASTSNPFVETGSTVTNVTYEAAADVPTESFDTAVLFCDSAEVAKEKFTHSSTLPHALKALRKGATVKLALPAGASAEATQVESELTLSGFVDVVQFSEAGSIVVAAKKPSWDPSSTAKLTFKRKTPAADAPASHAATSVGGAGAGSAPVVLAAVADDDLVSKVVISGPAGTSSAAAAVTGKKSWGAVAASAGDADLLDEDSLLDADALPAKAVSSEPGACPPKRRACANCTCGRKEEEEKEAAGGLPAPPTSSCGNCWKGDAFRCATCPHLGKPAFKPGMDGAVLLDTSASDF